MAYSDTSALAIADKGEPKGAILFPGLPSMAGLSRGEVSDALAEVTRRDATHSPRGLPPVAAMAPADLPPSSDHVGAAGSAGVLSFEQRRRNRQVLAETTVRPGFRFEGEALDTRWMGPRETLSFQPGLSTASGRHLSYLQATAICLGALVILCAGVLIGATAALFVQVGP